MSVRESRLCDHVRHDGSVCPMPFEATCPLCERDVCSAHLASDLIVMRLARHHKVYPAGGGPVGVDVKQLVEQPANRLCDACMSAASDPEAAPDLAAGIKAVFVTIRARLAAKALERS